MDQASCTLLLKACSFLAFLLLISCTLFTKPQKNVYGLALPLAFFITGIIFQKISAIPFLFLCIAIICFLSSFAFFQWYQKLRLATFSLLCSFMWFGCITFELNDVSYQKTFNNLKGKKLILFGKVTEKSVTLPRTIKKFKKDNLRISIHSVRDIETGKICSSSFDVICYVPPGSTGVKIADTVQLKDIIIAKPKEAAQLTGASTFGEYLKRERIIAALFLKKDQIELTSRPVFSLVRSIASLKESLYLRLMNKMSIPSFAYFSSLFLGNKKDIQIDEEKNWFSFWGISHYLARSGLHIVIFILLWRNLLRLLPLWYFLKQLILLLICIIYHFLSWESISFLRALWVFLLHQCGIMLHQQTHSFHLLNIVCFITLLFNPMHLFFLDFQLSFALTFALIWIVQPFKITHEI